jgi:NADPH-dependent curcumin reductase CurA
MTVVRTHTWLIRENMDGLPDVGRIFEKKTEDLDVALADDEMLLATRWVSVDSYTYSFTRDTPPGHPLGAETIMEVLEAGPRARFRPGDLVEGWGGWRSHVVSNGEGISFTGDLGDGVLLEFTIPPYRLLDRTKFDETLPVTSALGVLGAPGMTAWGALKYVLDVRPGQTMLISGATGIVGTLAGQLAKRAGAYVIGTTSTPEKAEYLTGLGFDDVLLYRHGDDADEVRNALVKAAPDRIDRYFDNLGGALTDAVFTWLNRFARVAVSWQWSTHVGQDTTGPRLLPFIIQPSVTVRGIFVEEWWTEENQQALYDDLAGPLRSGDIRYEETVFEGFDALPQAYHALYHRSAGVRGKLLVKL